MSGSNPSPTQADAPKQTPRQKVHMVSCAVGAGLLGFCGFMLYASPDSWSGQRVIGPVIGLSGLPLVPPLMEELRKKWPILRRAWLPVLYFVAATTSAGALFSYVTPTPAEAVRMQAADIAGARDLLRAGDLDGARERLARYARGNDREVAALLAAIDRAENSERARSEVGPASSPPAVVVEETPQQRLVERIETYWLPEVQQWRPATVDDQANLSADVTALERFAAYVIDARGMDLSSEQRRVLDGYLLALGRKQLQALPSMRRAYVQQLDAQLFRHDVRASAHGSGNRTLRLTGSVFVRNANIEDMQQTEQEAASKLRFSRIEYRWNPQVGETTSYRLEVPGDQDVGTWENGAFRLIL